MRPAGQSALALQPQTPPPRQRCPVRLVVQFAQTPPGAPQVAGAVPIAHVPVEQQPVMQVPLPAAPQAPVHTPAAHVGVSPVHAPHALPPAPHVALSCAAARTQVFPWQQPAHVAALHTQTPAEHAWPVAQLAHVPPAAPHAVTPVPVWQVPLASQQPVGQVAGPHRSQWCVVVLQRSPEPQSALALQPQAPDTHRCPTGSALQSRQVPPGVPHALGVLPATHWPPAVQQPAAHGPLPAAPHAAVQAPAAHVGDSPVHAAHATPAAPHVPLLSIAGGTHTPDAQQPPHDVPLHPQVPARHA